jgi:hypothetical protein
MEGSVTQGCHIGTEGLPSPLRPKYHAAYCLPHKNARDPVLVAQALSAPPAMAPWLTFHMERAQGEDPSMSSCPDGHSLSKTFVDLLMCIHRTTLAGGTEKVH